MMIASSETVHPERLDDSARTRLRCELLPLISTIFDGPAVPALTDALVNGSLGKVTLQRYWDADERHVGFAALILDEFEQDGEPWSVFRAFTGLLPEYRGQQSMLRFFIATLATYLVEHRRRRVFFFTPIAHISSYRMIAKHALEAYPHPAHPLSPEMQALMQRLGARYGYTPIEGEHPLVCRRAVWVAHEAYPKGRENRERDEFDRFYQRLNPRVGKGLCLLTLVPLSLGHVSRASLRYLRTRIAVKLRAARRGLGRSPGARGVI